MFKRLGLFLLTNILVIITISVITSALGLHGYLSRYGLDYGQLAAFCAVWGMTGSIISLLISKMMAKMSLNVQLITATTHDARERLFYTMVKDYARKLKIAMPEVGVYDSPELNAFATGPSRNNALVAVSSALLRSMNETELAGVIGHEMSHIANGDMVTMTMLQGVVNSFAMFLSRICAYGVSLLLASRNNDQESSEPSPMVYNLSVLVFDILFTILGSVVVAAFSRWREFGADAGGAHLAGRDTMIAALQRLQLTTCTDERAPALASLKINHPSGWLALLATHPSLAERIARLQSN